MHLLGVSGGGAQDWARLVLVRRERRGVTKVYRIIEVEAHPPGTPFELLAGRVVFFYRRPELMTTATRFSQVGRPRKRMRKRPTVVVDITGSEAIPPLLQECKIPFHTVRRGPELRPWCVCHGTGRAGGDFHVPDSVLTGALDDVLKQDRVIVDPGNDAVFGSQLLSAGDGPTAAAICIWYEENLLQIRRVQPAARQACA